MASRTRAGGSRARGWQLLPAEAPPQAKRASWSSRGGSRSSGLPDLGPQTESPAPQACSAQARWVTHSPRRADGPASQPHLSRKPEWEHLGGCLGPGVPPGEPHALGSAVPSTPSPEEGAGPQRPATSLARAGRGPCSQPAAPWPQSLGSCLPAK